MARTHTFKGSASAGYGYAAFIEDGQLVITEDWGREGGVLYRGTYRDSEKYLNKLAVQAPKLFSSITKYYAEEAKKESSDIKHRFNDSRDSRGNGYSGYISVYGELVLEYDDPRNGGEYYRGSYDRAGSELRNLKTHDPVLYNDIERYFSQKQAKAQLEKTKKEYGFDEETKTILFKVKLFMDNHEVHNVLVRGRFQADVIKKLMPPISEVLTLQTYSGDVFAVRSGKISAVEFVED